LGTVVLKFVVTVLEHIGVQNYGLEKKKDVYSEVLKTSKRLQF
jgi:hypothetical protein